ncbi:FAD:protein FMN transferase [Duganella sp. FT134W]|uniref:FAD:protein FMN transferase n=1 Tax=Duganella margarita TaxID=2692170 RepID=A0A7X4H0U2_9BURK|nr:FAD:protein FMN transferase [Duganella margarita]MYM73242.1 FAD:protein FMN transferase [Duganella margarita]
MRRVLLPHDVSDDPAPAGGVIRDYAGRSMGTSWSVRLVAAADAVGTHLQDGLQQQLDSIVAEMSHWETGSDLGRFNRAPADSWHVLPPAFFDVLSFAMDVARASGGAYDPTAGTLVNLWGFGPWGRYDQPDFVPPSNDEITIARSQLAARPVRLQRDGRQAWQPGGVQLDLSAVAKGYSVDRLSYYLKTQGFAHHLVEVGGELRGAGVKPDGQPWWVMLEQVTDIAPGAAAPDELVLALHGLAVATSGDYRRYFELDGKRYSHTVDPRSGMPIANDLASVTVVHAQCMAADAWSTALTVLGWRDGLHLAELHGLAARFVVRQPDGGFAEYLSTHLRSMLDE